MKRIFRLLLFGLLAAAVWSVWPKTDTSGGPLGVRPPGLERRYAGDVKEHSVKIAWPSIDIAGMVVARAEQPIRESGRRVKPSADEPLAVMRRQADAYYPMVIVVLIGLVVAAVAQFSW